MKPKPQGFSEEHELRPYREGDAINLIHWKLSSKYDEPIVREPQELVRKDIVLSVDLPDDFDNEVAEEIDGLKSFYITLNSDGTVEAYDADKDGAPGTWTLDGDLLTINVEGGKEHTATYNGESFVMTENETVMTFEKN